MIELTTTICRSDATVGSELDSEMVMINIHTGTYHSLNRTGSQIWAALTSPVVMAQLCEQVAAAFAVPTHQCEHDVIRFVERLVHRGLVQVVATNS